jgi:class I fructose-bisphosphate aldolase
VAHAARIGAETWRRHNQNKNFTGSIDTSKCGRKLPVPVVIAGGPKCKTSEELLQTVHDSLKAGGSGLSIGRNVFQHENPALIARALSAIVHKGASVEAALKILGEKQ